MESQIEERAEQRASWQSRIECITALSQWALAKKINDLYRQGLWVVGTQTFAPRHGDTNWTAFVYFKVKA